MIFYAFIFFVCVLVYLRHDTAVKERKYIWLRETEKKFIIIPFRSPSSPIGARRERDGRPGTQRDS